MKRMTKKRTAELQKMSVSDLPKGRASINEHEGKKYLREIVPAATNSSDKSLGRDPILVDVYAVLKAFKVTCPATQHCIKKLLCAGLREKGDRLDDLNGAMAALNRAIDLEEDIVNEPGF